MGNKTKKTENRILQKYYVSCFLNYIHYFFMSMGEVRGWNLTLNSVLAYFQISRISEI